MGYYPHYLLIVGTIWFKGDEDLSTEICEATESSEVDAVPECCSCGVASYRMTFYGMWSPQSHPKYYPGEFRNWYNYRIFLDLYRVLAF